MRTKRLQRGTSLLEAMMAMGVLMIGAVGLVGLQTQSTYFMGDSRRTTRAAMFAQDLVNQIELWDYTDPRLDNTQTDNDGDLGDSAEKMSLDQTPLVSGLADHGEADLGAGWVGLPQELLLANGMERYWNVADGGDTNGNGKPDAKRIAVIVRWEVRRAGAADGQPRTWRRMVFMVTKINPADLL